MTVRVSLSTSTINAWQTLRGLLPALSLLTVLASAPAVASQEFWTERDKRILRSLSLATLGEPPPVPSNRYADDPKAAAFGKRLFFDAGLSGNGMLSCASCHRPERDFTDGLPRGVGRGEASRNTPTLIGVAYQDWFYWDGRRDSLWSQALVPIEAPLEMAGNRVAAVHLVLDNSGHRESYEKVFGAVPRRLLTQPLPRSAGPYGDAAAKAAWQQLPPAQQRRVNAVFSNLGKAIAAYERTLQPPTSRFDRYVAALLADGEAAAQPNLTETERAGAKLFIDQQKTRCLQCHNGPRLSNGGFHNVGSGNLRAAAGRPLDFGRSLGLRAVVMDEFNCLGPYSDAPTEDCHALRFLDRDAHSSLQGAFKTPSLRNAASTAPYFHDGRFDSLMQVMRHYNNPPPASTAGPHELSPMRLAESELQQLAAFIQALGDVTPATKTPPAARRWSTTELALLDTLRLPSSPPPPDPGNGWDDRLGVIALGKKLFFEKRLSRDGSLACASCHDPAQAFSDGRKRAFGRVQLKRNAPSLLGVAGKRWLYWDGRKDSLWSQALEPLEASAEMGSTRSDLVRLLLGDTGLAADYQRAFGRQPATPVQSLPAGASPLGSISQRNRWARLPSPTRRWIDLVFVDIGRAIAAFERTLALAPTRFDAYLDAVLDGPHGTANGLLDDDELAGLRLFISGRTQCLSCHLGPRFSDGKFHNIGTGNIGQPGEDQGRAVGRIRLRDDQFNCRSQFHSDYPQASCDHLEDMFRSEVNKAQTGAFRTPSLRGLTATAPYLHDGRFANLSEVVDYYRNPPDKLAVYHELSASIDISERQSAQIIAFLKTLSAPADIR